MINFVPVRISDHINKACNYDSVNGRFLIDPNILFIVSLDFSNTGI